MKLPCDDCLLFPTCKCKVDGSIQKFFEYIVGCSLVAESIGYRCNNKKWRMKEEIDLLIEKFIIGE
jgi:hypothetical protein